MTIGGYYISHPGSYALIAIFVLIEIAGMGDQTIGERWSLSTYQIRKRKEWYRLISAGFVHVGFLHVFMNAMGIYYFGMLVEEFMGFWVMLAVFLISVVGGSIFCLRVRRKDVDYRAAGASGGVLGLMMFSVLFFPDIKLGLFLIPVMIPGPIFMILFVIGSLIFSQTADRNRISHEGHLGGALFGGLLGLGIWIYLGMGIENMESQVIFYNGFSVRLLAYLGVLPILLFWILNEIKPSWFYRK